MTLDNVTDIATGRTAFLRRLFDWVNRPGHAYATPAAVAADTVPDHVAAVQVLGDSAAGDGGGGLYIRAGSEPAHDDKVQSADGAWWELADSGGYVVPTGGEAFRKIADKLGEILSLKDFYDRDTEVEPGTGDADADLAAWNRMVAYINDRGATFAYTSATTYVIIPASTSPYILESSPDAIVVNDVHIEVYGKISHQASVFSFGQSGGSSAFRERFTVRGGFYFVPTSATPTSACRIMNLTNCGAVTLDGARPYRTGRVIHAANADTSGETLSGIVVKNITRGFGYHNVIPFYFDNPGAANMSSLGVLDVTMSAFPERADSIPVKVPGAKPIPVSAITQANPGVVTTSEAHGFTTGERVRMRNIGGMSALSSVDVTVTVLTTTTFSVGVDTSAYSAFTSGGWATARHWNEDGAVCVSINGQCDTAEIRGLKAVNYARGLELIADNNANKNIAYVVADGCFFDSLALAMITITCTSANVNNVYIDQFQGSCYGAAAFQITRSSTYQLQSSRFSNGRIDFTGSNFLLTTGGVCDNVAFEDFHVQSSNRMGTGTDFIRMLSGSADNTAFRNIQMLDPAESFGSGADSSMRPNTGFHSDNVADVSIVEDCLFRVSVQGFDLATGAGLPTGTARRFARNREILAGTERLAGDTLYAAVTVGSSPFSWTNTTGRTGLARIFGGTVSDIALNAYASGSAAARTVATATGALVPVGTNQTITLTFSSAPTFHFVGLG